MRWMVSVERVSRSAREGGEGLEDIVFVVWRGFGAERSCRGASLRRMKVVRLGITDGFVQSH